MEEVVFKARIEGIEKTASSVKEVNSLLKELQSIADSSDFGSEAYVNAQNEIEKLESSFKEFKNQGVQPVTNAFKDLKTELKAAQGAQVAAAAKFGEGSEQYKEATLNVAKLRDKMEDLNDSTKSLKGSGVERISNSFGLLGDGLKSFDFDKIKTGFKGIGSAMSAIPVLLIVQGITYLVSNFKELSEGSGVLAKVLQGVGAIFSWIGDKITALTDAIGLSNSELEKQGKAIKENSDKNKEALAGVTAEYDRQIAVAKANGKSTVAIEKAKQQAIIDTAKVAAESVEAYVRAGGLLDDEHKKLLTASLETIKNSRVTQFVAEKADQKQSQEAYKKHLEELRKIKADADAYAKKKKEDDAIAEKLQEQAALELDKINTLQDVQLTQDEINAIKAASSAKATEDNIKSQKNLDDLNREGILKKLALTKAGLQGASDLSDLFFTLQLNKTKGNAAQELAVRKQQFQVEKAFKVAQIVMDGIQGGIKAYAMNPLPSPIGIISASLQGIAAAAAAAKVLSTQFNAGGGGTASVPSISGGSLPSNSVPQVNNFQSNQGTLLDQNGKPIVDQPKAQVIKVINVVSDTTSKQNEIATAQNRALI